MALEDRVRQLEDEIKVLKNEVQQTLLEIKEQILLNRYPALHSANNAANGESRVEEPATAFVPIAKKYKTNVVILEEEDEAESSPDSKQPEEKPAAAPPPKPAKSAAAPPPAKSPNGKAAPPLSTNGKAAPAPAANGKNGAAGPVETPAVKPPPAGDEYTSATASSMARGIDKFRLSLEEDIYDLIGIPFDDDQIEGGLNIFEDMFSEALTRLLQDWVDQSVETLGREKAAHAIELYARSGEIPESLKDALLVLVHQSPLECTCDKPPGIKWVIDHLGKLNELLDSHSPEYLSEVLAHITEVSSG